MADYLEVAQRTLAARQQAPQTKPDPRELSLASALLNEVGTRIVEVEGGTAIGVWSDLHGPEVRAALRAIEADSLPIRYLDGNGIAEHYKVRRIAGEPVPMSVLAEMERYPAEPWIVRDRMLNGMEWADHVEQRCKHR